MRTLYLLVVFLTICFTTSCIKDEIIPESKSEIQMSPKNNFFANCNVNTTMMQKYLSISHKDTALVELREISKDGKIVAFYAQYENGWELLSADKRLSPVLISNSEGSLDFSIEENNASNELIDGILNYVSSLDDSYTTINPIWEKLDNTVEKKSQLKTKNSTTLMSSNGTGMWIAYDSIAYDTIISYRPHIISTEWGQGVEYNTYTPYYYNSNNQLVHSKVGCAAVGTGQVIAHYRKSNNRGLTIPHSAFVPYVANFPTTFSEYSTNNWQNLNNESDETAIFLAKLGQQMGLDYSIGNGTGNVSKIITGLHIYGLNFVESNSYNFDAIYHSLQNLSPVIISSQSIENDIVDGHIYIIDAFRVKQERFRVRYYWDPYHEVTDWEAQHLTPDRFYEPMIKDIDEIVWQTNDELLSESISFAMNWGWSNVNNCNNQWYSMYSKQFSTDGGGMSEFRFSPIWYVSHNNTQTRFYNIERVLYNFNEMIPLE